MLSVPQGTPLTGFCAPPTLFPFMHAILEVMDGVFALYLSGKGPAETYNLINLPFFPEGFCPLAN